MNIYRSRDRMYAPYVPGNEDTMMIQNGDETQVVRTGGEVYYGRPVRQPPPSNAKILAGCLAALGLLVVAAWIIVLVLF